MLKSYFYLTSPWNFEVKFSVYATARFSYSSLTFIRKSKSVTVLNTSWDNARPPTPCSWAEKAAHPDRSATQIAPNDVVVLFGVSLCCFYISLQMFVCLAAFDVSLCGCSVFQRSGRWVIVVFFFFSSQMLFTVLPPRPPIEFAPLCGSIVQLLHGTFFTNRLHLSRLVRLYENKVQGSD